MEVLNFQENILTFMGCSGIIAHVGRVAQLVEQLTLNQRAQSSNLCAPTILKASHFVVAFSFIRKYLFEFEDEIFKKCQKFGIFELLK